MWGPDVRARCSFVVHPARGGGAERGVKGSQECFRLQAKQCGSNDSSRLSAMRCPSVLQIRVSSPTLRVLQSSGRKDSLINRLHVSVMWLNSRELYTWPSRLDASWTWSFSCSLRVRRIRWRQLGCQGDQGSGN